MRSAEAFSLLYRIMREYMPTRGTLGHDMMFRSCTIQVSLTCSLTLIIRSSAVSEMYHYQA